MFFTREENKITCIQSVYGIAKRKNDQPGEQQQQQQIKFEKSAFFRRR